mgnify:CR=1 FL=1|tara:strand:+ start:1291 stop:2130 length:840 start_codon:yes stop_codon:yes gene_type:complete
MANLTSTTVTGTLNTTSTITGPASGASALNASNVSSGTLNSARLPTVPTSKGGTGLTSIGSADQVLKVNSGGTALEFGEAGGGGNYIRRIYTSPATWSKPADVQAVKVTVIGGGGNGGRAGCIPNGFQGGTGAAGGYSDEYLSSPSIPGPVSVSVGPAQTSSFGAFLSATAGANGGCGDNPSQATTGPGGSGSGGDINLGTFCHFDPVFKSPSSNNLGGVYEWYTVYNFGYSPRFAPQKTGCPGCGFGGGGAGGKGDISQNPAPGGNGAPGVVIVEEFY